MNKNKVNKDYIKSSRWYKIDSIWKANKRIMHINHYLEFDNN